MFIEIGLTFTLFEQAALLLTTCHLPLTTYHLFLTTYFLLLTAYFSLLTWPVLAAYYSLLHPTGYLLGCTYYVLLNPPPRAGLACSQQAAVTKGW